MDISKDALLEDFLVCPICKGSLNASSNAICCISCEMSFPCPEEGYFDLLPEHYLRNEESQWIDRQRKMEAWYQGLISNPALATSCFKNDYDPYVPILAALSGTVLDLGGGNGVTRHYLPPEVRYVVVDPSLDWLGTSWTSIAACFPCLATTPCFVRGIGEYLPFQEQLFDAVLAFWSLNHVGRPEQVLQEVNRVLKPGGLFLVVLEDMEPGWLDLFNRTFQRQAIQQAATVILEGMKPGWRKLLGRMFPSRRAYNIAAILAGKIRHRFLGREWPVHDDHIRIRESDIWNWSRLYFKVNRRAWIGHYLTYEFNKLEPSVDRKN